VEWTPERHTELSSPSVVVPEPAMSACSRQNVSWLTAPSRNQPFTKAVASRSFDALTLGQSTM
jgi:hypothetical protein